MKKKIVQSKPKIKKVKSDVLTEQIVKHMKKIIKLEKRTTPSSSDIMNEGILKNGLTKLIKRGFRIFSQLKAKEKGGKHFVKPDIEQINLQEEEVECFKIVIMKIMKKIYNYKRKVGKLYKRKNLLLNWSKYNRDKGLSKGNFKKYHYLKRMSKKMGKFIRKIINRQKEIIKKYNRVIKYGDIVGGVQYEETVDSEMPRNYSKLSWRNSEQSHVAAIDALKTIDTFVLFGEADTAQLIEHSYRSITLYYNKKIIGFVAVNDYPNVPSISLEYRYKWFENFYGIKNIGYQTTLFIHSLIWDKYFERMIMEPLLVPIFIDNGYLQRLIILPPKPMQLKGIFIEYFKLISGKRNKSFPIYMTPRSAYLHQWVFDKLCDTDNIRLEELITEKAPQLIEFYGTKITQQIIQYKNPHREFFLLMENKFSYDAVGFISYSDQVNCNVLKDNYDVLEYNGFKKPTKHDMRDDGSTKLGENIDTENQKQTKKILKKFIKKAIVERNMKFIETGEYPTANIPENLCEYTRIPDVYQIPTITTEVEDVLPSQINERNFMEFITLRDLCLQADLNGKTTMSEETNKIDPPLQYFTGKNNAFSIEMFLPLQQKDKKLHVKYLKQGFERYLDLDFILVPVPKGDYSNPLIQYLNRVDRINTWFPFDLFAGHRSLFFWNFHVRKASSSDKDVIFSMTAFFDDYEKMQNDLTVALKNPNAQNGTLLLLVANKRVAGLALVCQELDIEFLRYHYNLDFHMENDLHKADEHGLVKYFLLNELHRHLTRHFLRAIMRYLNYTSLYCYQFPVKTNIYFSIVHGLDFWIPVRPRLIPDYWACTNEISKFYNQDKQPFALFYINYRIASKPKEFFYERIVIVGNGELGTSFLENIIFNNIVANKSFCDITVVTMNRLPRKHRLTDLIECMYSHNGRYNSHYRNKIPIVNCTKFVRGTMVEIMRKEKQIKVIEYGDNKKKLIEYDYLFLFCGEQYSDPRADLKITIRGCRAFYNDRATFENKFLKRPKNLFTINSFSDVHKFFQYISKSLKADKICDKLVIYGQTIDVWSFISQLKLTENSFLNIVVVKSPTKVEQKNIINNAEINDLVMNTLRESNIEVYDGYCFYDWVVKNSYITKVSFASNRDIIELGCHIFVSFHPKEIYYQTFLAIVDAGLAFNGKLVIDYNFKTSDDFIYAAGSLTRYCNNYDHHYNHKYYNSTEIGAEVARSFISYLTSCETKDEQQDKKYKMRNRIIEFTEPVVQYGYFPLGWSYLNVTGPKSRLYTDTSFSAVTNKTVLTTGSLEYGPGYFRITFNENNTIEDILCVTKNSIPYRNYIQLYGKHERLLNQLFLRYHSERITDFFEYFNDGWAFCIYHDRFYKLEEKIDKLLTKQFFQVKTFGKPKLIFYNGRCYAPTKIRKRITKNISLARQIVLSLRDGKWNKISQSKQECFDIRMSAANNIRDEIENLTIAFLSSNRIHLPMYINQSTVQEMYSTHEHSTILENSETFIGDKPYTIAQPENIDIENVKTINDPYVEEEPYLEKKKKQIEQIFREMMMNCEQN